MNSAKPKIEKSNKELDRDLLIKSLLGAGLRAAKVYKAERSDYCMGQCVAYNQIAQQLIDGIYDKQWGE